MTTDRREFLKTTAVAALAGAAGGTAFGKDQPAVYAGPIIDTHEHLWDLSVIRPPWLAGLTGHGKDTLGKSYTPADYDAAVKGLNVVKAVYMEVDVGDDDLVKEAEYVQKLCREGKTPMAAAVIGARPNSDGFAAYLDRFKGDKHIKGFRQCLHGGTLPADHCLSDAYVKGVRLCGQRGFSFDLVLRNDQLEIGAALIEKCPDTRFILDHCGNPHAGKADVAAWEKGLAKVASAAGGRTMCKVSGLYGNVNAKEWPAEKLKPFARKVIDLFGWDRLIFAGDWPVVNLGASFSVWVDAVREFVRDDPAANQRKLFHDNAAKFYGI